MSCQKVVRYICIKLAVSPLGYAVQNRLLLAQGAIFLFVFHYIIVVLVKIFAISTIFYPVSQSVEILKKYYITF